MPPGARRALLVRLAIRVVSRSRVGRARVARGRRRGLDDVLVLGRFLGLVASAGTGARADRAADHRTWRTRDRATDHRTGHRAATGTHAGTGLVGTLGSLAGDRTADRADDAANGRADRPAHDGPDTGACKRTGAGADGLGPALVVVDLGLDLLRLDVSISHSSFS